MGNDYFCDTGSITTGRFYSDPLWDGDDCEPPLNSCCTLNNPPWFYKQLSIDDIEMKVCRDQGITNEDICIEMVDINFMYLH